MHTQIFQYTRDRKQEIYEKKQLQGEEVNS